MSDRRLGAPFWRFWTASAISQVGDGIRVTALPLLAASLTREPVPVAAVTAAVWLPWLAFGVIGGAIVDRVDRRKLMRNCQLVRALLAGSLVAAVWTDRASIPLLITAAFSIGILEVLVDSSLYSVVPRLVPRSSLEIANGRIGAAEQVGNQLAGPPLGGMLFVMARALPFAVDCASFAVSGLLLHTIPGDFAAATTTKASIWIDIKEGMSFLWRHRLLRAIALGLGAMGLCSSAAWGVMVLFVLEILEVGPVGFGWLMASSAVGGIIGNLVGAGIARRFGRARAMVIPLIVCGLVLVLIALSTDAAVVAVLMFVEGFSIGIFNVVGRTLRQVLTPDRLLGRVTSSFRVLSYGSAAVGPLLGGWLAAATTLRVPFAVGGILSAAIAVAIGSVINERSLAAAPEAMAG